MHLFMTQAGKAVLYMHAVRTAWTQLEGKKKKPTHTVATSILLLHHCLQGCQRNMNTKHHISVTAVH